MYLPFDITSFNTCSLLQSQNEIYFKFRSVSKSSLFDFPTTFSDNFTVTGDTIRAHTACRLQLQSLSYVLPSTPHIGACIYVQITGHLPFESRVTSMRDKG